MHRHPRISHLLLQCRTWFVAMFQGFLVLVSIVFAWLLRFDFSLPYRRTLIPAALVLLLIRLVSFTKFKLLHGWWRYTGVSDAWDIAKSILSGTVLFWLVLYFLPFGDTFPRSVYVLEAILSGVSLSGIRLISRAFVESVHKDKSERKVILIGAGFAAQMILREIRRADSGYRAVGCIDDDLTKLGIKLQGVPVLGTVGQLQEVIKEHAADEVIIAVPSATAQQMRRFVAICEQTKMKFKTVPALRELIAGQIIVSQIRDVHLEDLLNREPVQIDLSSVRKEIAGHPVLVTGAAGSIGSELCRQILDCGPSCLVCLDQSESGLFFLRLDLSQRQDKAQVAFCVGDVADSERIRHLLSEYRPRIIFHAAAYKHVPMMESNVQEAVKNNVFALIELLNAAEAARCQSFVLISSDKAVNPSSVMGATKRICELIVASKPADGMRCVSVRFGNVLGSSGSVIPVLKQQLRNNQPLTVTHPEIKRFFMTKREAVALVLQAFAIGNHGNILVLDMGEPVRILDLAHSLIRLSGKSEAEVEIHFTGLREGEKLKEELFYAHEVIVPTTCEKIKRTNGLHKNWGELCRQLEELHASMSIDGASPIRAKIKEIVPQYAYQEPSLQRNLAEAVSGSYFQKAAGCD